MRRYLLPALFAGFLLFSCARIQAPPGGPEDKSPPQIVSITPEPNGLFVPLDSEIEIGFNEYIKPVKNGAVILPSLEGAEAVVKGKRIAIKYKGRLEPNTTYRVSIASRISDYRNNRIAGSEGFAFSTGDFIDSLEIRGHVFSAELTPAADIRVEAFKKGVSPQSPFAVAWTGADGGFILRNLPSDEFLIRAYSDQNSNARPDHGEEFAIAPEYISAGQNPEWAFICAKMDTIPPRLMSAVAENAYVIKLRFSEDVSIAKGLARFSDSGAELGLLPDMDSRRGAFLLLDKAIPAGETKFELLGLRDLAGNELVREDFTVLASAFEPDTAVPSLSYRKEPLRPDQPLVVNVDRPLVFASIIVADSTGKAVPGRVELVLPYWIAFEPEGLWPARSDLVWRLDSCILSGGEHLTDSTRYRLGLIDRSKFGTLEVTHSLTAVNPMILAYSVDNKDFSKILERRGEKFVGDFLPEGGYFLLLFDDLNADSVLNRGFADPLSLSEPAYFAPDTVRVRGLWTTEFELRVRR